MHITQLRQGWHHEMVRGGQGHLETGRAWGDRSASQGMPNIAGATRRQDTDLEPLLFCPEPEAAPCRQCGPRPCRQHLELGLPQPSRGDISGSLKNVVLFFERTAHPVVQAGPELSP